MSSMEYNKITAAVLVGLLAFFGVRFIGELVAPQDHEVLEKHAYIIEMDSQPVSDAQKGEGKKKTLQAILPLLSGADIQAGQKVAKKCISCHAFDAQGAHKTGPKLWNIVGRDKGSFDDFNYSKAFKKLQGQWDYESLNAFLYRPKDYVPKTKMSFAGLKKAKDRANLIAWLRTLSQSPVALP